MYNVCIYQNKLVNIFAPLGYSYAALYPFNTEAFFCAPSTCGAKRTRPTGIPPYKSARRGNSRDGRAREPTLRPDGMTYATRTARAANTRIVTFGIGAPATNRASLKRPACGP